MRPLVFYKKALELQKKYAEMCIRDSSYIYKGKEMLSSPVVLSLYRPVTDNDTEELLEEYEVEYVFVGSCERSKYGENLNNEMMQNIGEIVFETDNSQTYIVKVK